MSTGQAAYRPDGTAILVADDEPATSTLVKRILAAEGCTVSLTCEIVGREPDGPGQPVLILFCVSDGLAHGGCCAPGTPDAQLSPAQLAELLARVGARLRDDRPQDGGFPKDGGLPKDEVIRVGRLGLDTGRLQADAGAGPVPLTRLEFLLLRILMDRAGQAVPKGQLLASVWGLDFDPGSNVVDVCVRRLRSKLGYDLIKTVRGAGYQLAA
jgi:two-component system OmpR family response regulator